jgi:hypothetical protein
MSRFKYVDLSRFIVAVILFIASIQLVTGLTQPWREALRLSAVVIAFHWLVEKTIPYTRDHSSLKGVDEEVDEFLVASIGQVVNWLITGSGVIIGLIAKGPSLTSLGKASALSLVLCIVLGFIHISVLAGGVHSETPTPQPNAAEATQIPKPDKVVKIQAVNFLYATILLNAMFIFFLFGIVGLTVGLL